MLDKVTVSKIEYFEFDENNHIGISYIELEDKIILEIGRASCRERV